MDFKGKKLDKFQEDAIHAIEQGKSVVVCAPTGSGKTLIADYIIDRDFESGVKVIYTAPIKALSNQKFRDFTRDYGEDSVGLITGDVVKNATAPILVMTTEVYRNMLLSDDEIISKISYVIFDEVHYINDIERGYVWEESIIFSKPHIRMLFLSATIPNAGEFAGWVSKVCGHEVAVVKHDERSVPLHIFYYDSELGICTLNDLRERLDIADYKFVLGRSRNRQGRLEPPSHIALIEDMRENLPAIFFGFSRAQCQKMARELCSKKFFEADSYISSYVSRRLSAIDQKISMLESVLALREVLPYGIAFHHAGMLPVLKDVVEELFEQGKIKVLYATETFAVGVNMPARSVCIASLRKFDGQTFRHMHSREFFQMAGRAGRRGIDTEGFVYIVVDRQNFSADKMKRSLSTLEPLSSQFRLSYNTVLNLIKRHSEPEIDKILAKSFDSYLKYGDEFGSQKNIRGHQSFINMKKILEKEAYLQRGRLTEKGEFASKIYSEELLLSEIFSSEMYKNLNQYQLLLVIACICLESDAKFVNVFDSKDVRRLHELLLSNELLRRSKKFDSLLDITAIVHPCHFKADFMQALLNSGMPEGDLIRFYRQIMDRLNQVKNATTDPSLADFCRTAIEIVSKCLSGIDQ